MAGGIVVASPAQAHVYEAVPIGGDPPVKGRWRDGPMLRTAFRSSPKRARAGRCAPARVPIVFRDRGAGHGASRTGATQMAASAPDAPDSVSSNAQSGRRGRSSCGDNTLLSVAAKARTIKLRRVTARVTGRSKADGGRASCWSIVSSPDRRAPLGDRRSAPSTARREHARRRGSACEYRDRCRPGCSATTLRRGAPPAGLHRG